MTTRVTRPIPASSTPNRAAPPVPSTGLRGPDPRDVEQLTYLLDLTRDFTTEQRARYLLSSDWLRDRGAQAARRIAEDLAALRAETTPEVPCARCGLRPDALVHHATANGHAYADAQAARTGTEVSR